MNMPLVLLNRRRRAGGFSPYVALFANDERGVFLDPSDTANLSWRRNLLTWTEQFDNAAWFKTASTTVTANQGVAPDGTTTADLVTSGGAAGYIYPATGLFASAGGATYTYSAYFKAGTATSVQLLIAATATYTGTYNLSTGIATTGTANTTVSMTDVGSGWYRCVLTCAAVANTVYTEAQIGRVALGLTFQVWGAQLEVGSTASTYQVITDLNTEVRANFPNATLYQDTAGTTPVTTPGQSVALALDKSRGLVPGADQKANGATAIVGTATAATYSTTTGAGTCTRVDAVNQSYVAFTGLSASTYLISITNTGSVVMYIRAGTGTGAISYSISPGSNVVARLFATSGAFSVTSEVGTSAFTVNSVRELPGNHAVQGTAGSRPLYALLPANGVRNLLTWTEQFDNAVWSSGTVTKTANTLAAPNGTVTADTITRTATGTGENNVRFTTTQPNATAHTFSCYVKAGSAGARLYLRNLAINDGITTGVAQFNPADGTVSLTYGSTYTGAASMTDVGNGWYRCRISGTTLNPVVNNFIDIGVTDGASAVGGTSGAFVYIWGAQLEIGSTATNYQRVEDRTNIAQPPFAQVGALLFDGVDDFLQTPSVDFAGYEQLGSELVTNGTFTTDLTGWADTGGDGSAVASAGVMQITQGATAQEERRQNVTVQAGRFYKVSATLGGVSPFLFLGSVAGAADLGNISATGSIVVLATTNTISVRAIPQSALGSGSVATYDDISVKEVLRPADKVTVFAGVRKLSDAAQAELIGLSATPPASSGTFWIQGPNSAAGANYVSNTRGSLTTTAIAGSLAAPDTSVLSASYDISGDVNILRRNGSQVATGVGDLGTGNFSNNIIYIGRRAGTSLPFNGYLYSLIVRGAATSADLITLTERWVNQRTGAY